MKEHQKPEGGRHVYPEEGQVEGSCRGGVTKQCCMEDKAQGHIPQRKEHAYYGCLEDRRGEECRWPKRGIQVSKGDDQGREQHKAILILRNLFAEDLGITVISWREESKFRAEQERQRNWRVGVRGGRTERKGTGICVWKRWKRSLWNAVCNCAGEREGELMEISLMASWWWAVGNAGGRSGQRVHE